MSEIEYANELIRVKGIIRKVCLEIRERLPPTIELLEELLELTKPYARPKPWDRDLNNEWANLLAVEKALKELNRVLGVVVE